VISGFAGLVVLAALVPLWQAIDTSSATPPATTPTPSGLTQTPPTKPDSTEHTASGPDLTWSSRPVPVVHQVPGETKIVNLRVAQHGTYDRVVVDVAGPISSYDVGYVSRSLDPSGVPGALPGASVIGVRVRGTTHDDQGRSLFLAAKDPTYSLPMVLASTYSDFEGRVDFGLGLTARTRFRVFELSAPNRIVIDIHH